MLLLSELWAGAPRRIPRPDYLLYALQRRQRYSGYSSFSSPVSGSRAIWPIVTQPSLQAWGRSSWSSWCGAAWKGSPAGDILMVSTVTSKSVWAAPPGDYALRGGFSTLLTAVLSHTWFGKSNQTVYDDRHDQLKEDQGTERVQRHDDTRVCPGGRDLHGDAERRRARSPAAVSQDPQQDSAGLGRRG